MGRKMLLAYQVRRALLIAAYFWAAKKMKTTKTTPMMTSQYHRISGGKKEDSVLLGEPVIQLNDEDVNYVDADDNPKGRFLGGLPPDNPIWQAGEIRLHFPEGLFYVPSFLAHWILQ